MREAAARRLFLRGHPGDAALAYLLKLRAEAAKYRSNIQRIVITTG